ncbi:MAG: serine hydrolase domain-containing protein [Pseudomonadota bacterium]
MTLGRLIRITSFAAVLGLAWLLWPAYGFYSNQFETMRLPFGWMDIPEASSSESELNNPAFEDAANSAMAVLSKRRADIGAPSLSAAISIDGELVWAGAVGWRNVEKKLPATVETAYRIGSTSKPVGITGLARLVVEGKIDLDTPIGAYSADLPNEAWNAFTARQLASHTAGLPGYEENDDWVGLYRSIALRTRFNDPRASLSMIDSASLQFEPRSDFLYSGFDNILLSVVQQDAAGQAFNASMDRSVFDPLGMDSTFPDYLRPRDLEYATSYQVKGTRVKPWRHVDLSHKIAAGGYVSTPSDLVRLGSAWLNDDFIPESVRTEFWTPVVLSSGEVNEQNYALGFRRSTWEINGVGEITHLNHGGVSKGAQCWLMIVPEHNIVLAISTNRRTDQFFDFADVYVDLLEVFIPAAE